jgi:hypothetical protein
MQTTVPGYRGLADWPFVGATNYYAAMAIDLTAALAFLGFGIRWFAGLPTVAGGVVILGFMSAGSSMPERQRARTEEKRSDVSLMSVFYFVEGYVESFAGPA